LNCPLIPLVSFFILNFSFFTQFWEMQSPLRSPEVPFFLFPPRFVGSPVFCTAPQKPLLFLWSPEFVLSFFLASAVPQFSLLLGVYCFRLITPVRNKDFSLCFGARPSRICSAHPFSASKLPSAPLQKMGSSSFAVFFPNCFPPCFLHVCRRLVIGGFFLFTHLLFRH